MRLMNHRDEPSRRSCVLLWCLYNILLVRTCDGLFGPRAPYRASGTGVKRSSSFPWQSTSSSEITTIESILLDRLSRNDTSSLSLPGYVLTKRKLGKGLVFVDFHLADYPDTCQAMLRQEYVQQDFGTIQNLLLRGTCLNVTGRAAPTWNPGNVVFLIQSVEFVHFPRQLQYIQMILQHYQKGFIPSHSLLRAVDSPAVQAQLLQLQASGGEDDPELLQQISRQVLQSLRHDPNYPVAAIQTEYTRPGTYSVSRAPPQWQNVPAVVTKYRETFDRTIDPDVAFLSIAKVLDLQTVSPYVDGTKSISVMGWVQNRRRFDQNIAMMALVDDYASLVSQDTSDLDMEQYSGPRLLCLLHPDLVFPPENAGVYRNLAAVGSLVKLQGRLVLPHNQDTNNINNNDQQEQEHHQQSNARVILWIESIHLEQSSSRPGAIRHVLDLVVEGKLDHAMACQALRIEPASDEAQSLWTLKDATQRQWKANQLVTRLQEASTIAMTRTTSQSSSTTGTLPVLFYSKNLDVLAKYEHLLESYPIHVTTLQEMEHLLLPEESTTPTAASTTASSSTLARTILEDRQQPAKNALVQKTILPLGVPGSRWQRKKRPQLAWMGQRIKEVLQSHPDYGQRPLEILDIGGGKGSLANYLGRTMPDQIRVHVVDISEGAVANGASRARRWNLPIEFSLADASQQLNLTADVVVALHACGHLSDVALAHAIQRQAGFVIVPCCFHSNSHLQVPWVIDTPHDTQPTNKTQWTVPEWLGIPSHDWEALTLLAEVQSDLALASQATAIICALRARAVSKFVEHQPEESQPTTPDCGDTERIIAIHRFPVEFSTRNTVLVGQCRRRSTK